MRATRRWTVPVLAALVGACGGTVAIQKEAGVLDAGLDESQPAGDASDARGPDTGAPDASAHDTGAPDTSAHDTSAPDTAVSPRDASDAGEAGDASSPDSSSSPDGCPLSIELGGGPCLDYGTTCSYSQGACACCPGPEGCFPLSCAQQGLNCGPAGDGCGNLLNCGACMAPETCAGGGKPGVCGSDAGNGPVCTPRTCADAGCGVVDDGCGGNIDCSAYCGNWYCSPTDLPPVCPG
jgi:hypothetical protein